MNQWMFTLLGCACWKWPRLSIRTRNVTTPLRSTGELQQSVLFVDLSVNVGTQIYRRVTTVSVICRSICKCRESPKLIEGNYSMYYIFLVRSNEDRNVRYMPYC
jgi:hypothetical protein